MSPQDARRIAMERHRAGDFRAAADAWARAAAVDPAHAETRNNLGVALQALNRLDDARDAFAAATRLRPDYADAWENLAGVLLASGREADAIGVAREMARQLPTIAASHLVLGTTLARAGRFAEAAEACGAGMRVEPENPDVICLFANIRAAEQRWADAAAAYASVIRLAPRAVPAYVNLGVCLASSGDLPAAAAQFREALTLDPNCGDAALRLADVLDRLGEQDAALASAKRATELAPNDAGALNLLASLTDRARNAVEAESLYQLAIAHDANHAPSLANYATLRARRGEIERAMPMLRRAVDAAPGEPVPHSSLCMYLNADPTVTPEQVFAEHRRWNARHARPVYHPERQQHEPAGKTDRRLRIGYVSPDWAGHPVARFLLPILESHDRERFEIHIYDDSAKPDAFTEQLRSLGHTWHRVRGVLDETLAERIRADRIDVLVDLAGHTADNRLLVFARKPAAVQVSYCGYPNSTGLDAMDYRLSDIVADAPDFAEQFHSEKLVRLPRPFLAFRPPVETPAVAEAPALRNGFVTFGSFHALWKINAPLLRLWSDVLKSMPKSRLLMKADGLEDPAVAKRVAAVFETAGVALDRVRLLGRAATYAGHLQAYAECDACLDTYPYAGTTTTCEALWMGVPVISQVGQTHPSRVGASLLAALGLSEELCVVPGFESSRAIAQLATNVDRLVEIRRGLRDRFAASPLADARSLTLEIERAFVRMWESA